jgi:hypothetical protein
LGGAPNGFSGGDGKSWSFPLIGPLEGGPLLVPVYVDGRGPYVFLVEPDAVQTVVDAQVVVEAKLRTRIFPNQNSVIDEHGRRHKYVVAEVPKLQLGELVITRRGMTTVDAHVLDRGGRRIHGLIGRDVLHESLIFGFDRDRAIGWLTTPKAFSTPPTAVVIGFRDSARTSRFSRHLVETTVGNTPVVLGIDLGAPISQLDERLWTRAGLESVPVNGVLVDEFGDKDPILRVTKPTSTRLGDITKTISFAAFSEQKLSQSDPHDGLLGLDFFDEFDVSLDWRAHRYYLERRTPEALPKRLARWPNSPLATCTRPACVTIRIVRPAADESQPAVLHVQRDQAAAASDIEVLLEARGRRELPRLLVNLPGTADDALLQLDGELAGAAFDVVDASPFPRTCPGKSGCIDKLVRWP